MFFAKQVHILGKKKKKYESKLDIYSFKSEFLKIYERTTPKQMMPDLLKNNLLEGLAL